MIVPVVDVGVVSVRVPQGFVPVRVAVRLPRWIGRVVFVSVVHIVDVEVLVLQRFVNVLVFVPFGQMETDAQSHERSGREEPERRHFPQHRNRDDGTDERGDGEVNAGPGRAERSQPVRKRSS